MVTGWVLKPKNPSHSLILTDDIRVAWARRCRATLEIDDVTQFAHSRLLERTLREHRSIQA